MIRSRNACGRAAAGYGEAVGARRERLPKPLRAADFLVLILGLAFAWEFARHASFSIPTLSVAVALSLLTVFALIRHFPVTVQ